MSDALLCMLLLPKLLRQGIWEVEENVENMLSSVHLRNIFPYIKTRSGSTDDRGVLVMRSTYNLIHAKRVTISDLMCFKNY